ncbi:hypothetical protein ACK6W9_002553 [Vibrio alginolyticus]
MPQAIEETIKHCKKCNKLTKHMRSYHKTGLIMFLVHICLTIVTAGVWLVLLIIWMLLNKKIGGWKCQECK